MFKIKNRLNYGLLILIVITFLLYRFKVDLSLFYQAQQPLLFCTFKSFINSLSSPAGLAIYLGEFLTEKLYYKNIGVFIIIAFQLLFLLPIMLVSKNRTILFELSLFIIWIGFYWLFQDYGIKLESLVSLLIALGLSALWWCFIDSIKKQGLRLLLLVTILGLSYWFGGGTSLIFASLLSIIFAIKTSYSFGNKMVYILCCVLLCIGLPHISLITNIQVVTLKTAYFGSFFSHSKYIVPISYYILALLLLIPLIITWIPIKEFHFHKKHKAYVSMLVSAFLVILAFFIVKNEEKQKLSMERLLEQKEWVQYLEEVSTLSSVDVIDAFNMNRALFHLGLLLEEGDGNAQRFGYQGLFIEYKPLRSRLLITSDMYWELGYINESRHWAHEAFTSYGSQPRILKRLVDVNIVLGKYNTANKYIVLLKKSKLHKQWAIEKERYLYNVEKCLSDVVYGEKITGLPYADFMSNSKSGIVGLENLVEKSNENRMVVEYLTMSYLLLHDLGHMVEMVPLFKNHNYKKLPNLVQQALLVYMAKSEKRPNLLGFSIDENQIIRFKVYSQLYASYKRGDKSAKEKITEKFSDTYWYYIHFVSTIGANKQ